MNHVQPGSFLTLHYRLAGPDGADLVSTFEGRPATLSLGAGEIAPAMEARLLGLAEGTHCAFELAPDEAFGARDSKLLQRVSRSLLDELGDPEQTYRVGDVVQFDLAAGSGWTDRQDGQGTDQKDQSAAPGPRAGVLREIDGDAMLFDFNHPLAGRAVTFEVQLIGVL